MAFIKTSDSIVIRATLTDEGRKLLARGEFKVSKFALGDDEIDYSLYNTDTAHGAHKPALENTKILEAYGSRHKNIQFGLNSFDSGILYLNHKERDDSDKHAHIAFIPTLKQNLKLSMSATKSGSVVYMSVNDETSQQLNSVPDAKRFNFLRPDNYDACRLIIESGIMQPEDTEGRISDVHEYDNPEDVEFEHPSPSGREYLILKKFLLDQDYLVFADNRFIRGFVGTGPESKFENFSSGEVKIRFTSSDPVSPISIESEFENFATYILTSIPNLLYDFFADSSDGAIGLSSAYSPFNGPRGSVLACNPLINQEMRTNSATERDFRFTEFGKTDQILFDDLPGKKFDYIDTTIYFIGTTTNSRIGIPIRIIRYSGT